MSIKVTYKLRRHDSVHFHGWIIWACYDGVQEEYFKSTSRDEARAVLRDLHPETF